MEKLTKSLCVLDRKGSGNLVMVNHAAFHHRGREFAERNGSGRQDGASRIHDNEYLRRFRDLFETLLLCLDFVVGLADSGIEITPDKITDKPEKAKIDLIVAVSVADWTVANVTPEI